MGCGGQKQSRARPASRTWRACRAFSIRTGRGLAGKLLNCRSPRVCNVFPVRRPIDHWLDSGRSPRPPTPASPATSPPTGRWPGGVLLPHSARSVGAVSPCPAHEMLPVASCSKSTTILPVGRVGGVLCRPSRGGKRASTRVQSTASVSCAFSMPPARSIGRPAPAGLAACGSGSDLAAGAQAGVGMLMSSPAYGSSGRGVSVASS